PLLPLPDPAQPAIWPLLLIDRASAVARLPSVPRSVITPFCQSTRWAVSLVSQQMPAIWPLLLIARPWQPKLPVKLGAGRPVIVRWVYGSACSVCWVHFFGFG